MLKMKMDQQLYDIGERKKEKKKMRTLVLHILVKPGSIPGVPKYPFVASIY